MNPALRVLSIGLIASCSLASGIATSAEAPVAPTLRWLDSIQAGDLGAELRVERTGASHSVARIGDRIGFQFSSRRDVHLIVLHLDSHGVTSVLVPSPLAPSGRIRAGRTLRVDGLRASAPVGQDRIYAIATHEPLDLEALGVQPSKDLARLDRIDSIRLVRSLAQELGRRRPAEIAISSETTRISGGDEIEYSVDEVIRQLTPTRGLSRTSIDFHQVQFAFDSSRLTEKAKLNLDVLGEALHSKSLADERIILGGHTDDVGAEPYNQRLSQRRATAAKAYLHATWSIPEDRIEVRGHGESRPLDPGKTSFARAMNRRVEVEVDR